ncbi:hypothetical protein AVEN_244750-1 [Araneus ventricosus]|uniref:Uncharacterized protein n=1 Tax=Araneus ventricosus TaxID=182803 RepID=A0A4Y2BRT7_ARAVE|nr:hypothetical protein AVEN_244750-1 [Araneus ventricosus]
MSLISGWTKIASNWIPLLLRPTLLVVLLSHLVYLDYEDEEKDYSSDISEVDLNLDTYKPSTSNHLISLTPKYKQLTLFVSKSSEIRLGLPSAAVVGDRFGVSDRAVAAIASSVLHDVGLITSNNSDLMVDNNKLRREKA